MNGSLYFYLFATHLFFLFQSSFSLTTLTLKYSGGQATEGQGGFYGCKLYHHGLLSLGVGVGVGFSSCSFFILVIVCGRD
mmetsp:Transcript_11463/g.16355  ORF Transcript_11463/g.16355 Transcript_11463/m.16355 type:complete len:80 (+) Transcript_11463:204-443(+)